LIDVGRPQLIDVAVYRFWTNWPLLERSKEFVADTLKGFTWLLDASKSRPE
jgi:hypothetical protein